MSSDASPTPTESGTDAPAPAPEGEELPRRRVIVIFIGLALSIITAAMNGTTVTTALPTIAGKLHGLDRMAWLVTAYLLGMTIAMPLYGKVGDLVGRKRVLHFALLVFMLGSALSGAAQTMTQLIIFRAVQGIGSGGLIVTAQGIIGDIVPARRRGRYMSVLAPLIGVATVGGPMLGGLLIDYASWRWIFYVNLPVGVLALVVTAVTLELPRSNRRPRLDVGGAALLGGAVAAIVLITDWGGTSYAWDSGVILGLAVGALVLLVAWALVERRVAEPIIPLRLFGDRVFAVGVLLGLGVGVGMFSVVTYIPTFLQIVVGASATLSGLLLLPLMGGMMAVSAITGQLMTATGRYKVFPILGTASMATGLYLLSTMGVDTPRYAINLYMIAVGAGIGLVMPVLTTAVQNSVPHSDLGTATAGVNFFRQIGGAIGAALAGALFTSRLQHQLAESLSPRAAARMGGQQTISPQAIARLPDALRHDVVAAFAEALPSVYLDFVPVLAVAFVAAWFMKEKPLGTVRSAARNAREAAPRTAADATDATSGTASQDTPQPAATRPAAATGTAPPGDVNGQTFVRGHVYGPHGSPLPRATMTMVDFSGHEVDRARTSEDGAYHLTAPATGTYLLVAATGTHKPEVSTISVTSTPVVHEITLTGKE